MEHKLEIRPLASLEIIEAYDWYEMQRDGLGTEFLEELEHFFNSLIRNPLSYSYYDEPVRQGKVYRFPYTVVFEVKDKIIVVYSVFMTRKDPSSKRTG